MSSTKERIKELNAKRDDLINQANKKFDESIKVQRKCIEMEFLGQNLSNPHEYNHCISDLIRLIKEVDELSKKLSFVLEESQKI